MFAKVYQTGETGVEIFSPSGSSDPLKIFQCSQEASSQIKKLYDRAIKGYIVTLENESPITKLHCPNKSYSTLHLTQPLLCLQLSVARDKAFSLEVSVLDKNHQRKRFHFSTHFKEKEAAATSPSAKLPWFRSGGSDWMTCVINLGDLCGACFPGFSFHSLDSFTLHPVCQLRKIFSLPSSKLKGVNDVEIPTTFDFPLGVDAQVFVYDPRGPLPLAGGRSDEVSVAGDVSTGGISIQGKGMTSMTPAVKSAMPTLSQRVRLKLKSRQTPGTATATVTQPPPAQRDPSVQESELNDLRTPSVPVKTSAATSERKDDVEEDTNSADDVMPVLPVHLSHHLNDTEEVRGGMMSAKSFLHLLTPPQNTEKEGQDDDDVSAYQRQMSDVRASLSSSFNERAREWREEVQRFALTSSPLDFAAERQSDDNDVRGDQEQERIEREGGFDADDVAVEESHFNDVSAVAEEEHEGDITMTSAGNNDDIDPTFTLEGEEEVQGEEVAEEVVSEGVNDVRFEEVHGLYSSLLDSVMTWSPSEKKSKRRQFSCYLDALQQLERCFLQNYGREDFEELVGEFVL